MAQFAVRVYTRTGVTDTQVEAENASEAAIRAAAKGAVLSVKRIRFARMGALSYNERQVFLSRFSAMLASRVGATQSLTLIRQTFTGRIKQVAHELLLKVEAGQSVPEAIVSLGGRDFPATTRAMIQAGANSGATSQALRDAMVFEQALKAIKSGASKGIWAGLAAFVIGILFVVGTVFLMVPRIMDSPLMKLTGGVENYETSIQLAYLFGYIMVAVLAILCLFFLLATVGKAVAPMAADSIILRIPLYRDIVLSRGYYISFYGLALLIKSGVRMEEAFRLIAESTPPGLLRNDFNRACGAVKQGESWPAAMRMIQPTDRAALAASMDRTQVSEAMDAISVAYRDLYAHRMALAAPIFQVLAALSLLVSGLVMFGLTMLPIVQMSTKLVQ
ncbi:MAG: type II secretion system F family protein [Salinisphaera sp.]|nr:type II secretion system F family protein [Salinisphaera sp.]